MLMNVRRTIITEATRLGDDAWSLLDRVATPLAMAIVLSLAMHFWPLEENRCWEMFAPQNALLYLAILCMVLATLSLRVRVGIGAFLPHVGILSFVAVSMLSSASSLHLLRSLTFTAKLAVWLIGGSMLFGLALRRESLPRWFLLAGAAAVAIAIGYSLIARQWLGLETYGFFANKHKYGTYVAMMASLFGGALVAGQHKTGKAMGMGLIVLAALSCGTAGCLLGLAAGVVAIIVAANSWQTRIAALGAAGAAAGMLILLSFVAPSRTVWNDFGLRDRDGVTVRQRYIEWQAMINLVGERPISGAGAGCVNDLRSMYYLGLPKLNTLEPYELNGWLQVAAETGIAGLVCFCWAILHAVQVSWRAIRSDRTQPESIRPLAVGALAALAAGCVANLYSSWLYNGILATMVLTLCLCEYCGEKVAIASDTDG